MKKVIKGKTYNTENAPCLCEWDNGEDPTNSLFYLEEGLYQKKDGSYFVAGRGGAKTKYAKYIGVDSWAGGSDITPVTDAQARKLVKNKRPEKYEEIFGSSDRYEIIDDNGERIAQIPDEAIDPEDGESFTYYDKTIVLPEFWLNDADSMDVVRDGHLVMTYITKSETSDDVLVKSASFDSMRKAQAKLDEWLDADKDAANADWVDYIIAVPVAYASQAASASVIPEDFITGAYGKDYTGKYKEDCDLYWPDEFMAEED